ncbi:DUF3263 domain-containing protein [Rhodococcus sp. WS4]|jgi:hypothetical protein|uniref:DUF3263 domain-containing protein n=1 Tax=Rhodococcus opacus TaxID=37919 RepID=UPI0015E88277|nr:hypothetical protein [Rhodococcus opacus]
MRRPKPNETAILNLACRWAPYGSVPASEIWVTFGMSPDRFYTILTRILGTLDAHELAPEQRQSLEHLAMRRSNRQTHGCRESSRSSTTNSLDEEWLPDGAELTPTMKFKRRSIVTKFDEVIEKLYS